MRRYFFHQRHGQGNILDSEGTEMATQNEAISYMRGLLVRLIQDGIAGDEYGAIVVNVRDSDDNHVASASISIQTEPSSDERSPTKIARYERWGKRRFPQRRA